jgi:hypothetical protein
MAKNRRNNFREESIEAKSGGVTSELKGLGKQMIDSTWKDLLSPIGTEGLSQILGLSETELRPGQEVSLKKKEEKNVVSTEHMEYFREVKSADTISKNRHERQITSQVEQIRMEIKRLVKTSTIVEQTVKGAVSDTAPVRPGKYHVSFFEFVLSTIKDATRKLEDSVSFGAIFQGKKKAKQTKQQHWTKVKEKGTQFGLSGERTVATQTG